MIGDEFKTARKFLLENLEGGIAWKDPQQAERQKERLKKAKSLQQEGGGNEATVSEQEETGQTMPEQSEVAETNGMSMNM